MYRCAAASSFSSCPPTHSRRPARDHHQRKDAQLRHHLIAATLAIASFGNVEGAEASNPSYSGVDPEQSPLIQSLLAKTKEDKPMLDQKRLDNYYNKKFLINEITGKEILPNPCDPRDFEFGGRCRTLPTLPRLPGETLPEFPAIINNSSRKAPSTQSEQTSEVESENSNDSDSGEQIEIAKDEDVADVVVN
jgi:hypothetical protein